MINRGDAFLEINTGTDGPEDFVTGAKDTFEKVKFLSEELINALISGILLVEEVNKQLHHASARIGGNGRCAVLHAGDSMGGRS